MSKNEIVKRLYKENPIATFMFIRMGVAYYQTLLPDEDLINSTSVDFEIPVGDMGSADFFPTMEAKHLRRWIVEFVE